MVLRPLPLALAAIAHSAPVGRSAELPPEPAHTFELKQVPYLSGAISEVELSRTETVKLKAEQAVDSAVEALRQAKVQLAQTARVQVQVTKVEYLQSLSATWNPVFQIEAATAMELVQ